MGDLDPMDSNEQIKIDLGSAEFPAHLVEDCSRILGTNHVDSVSFDSEFLIIQLDTVASLKKQKPDRRIIHLI